jgi:hypothetical protein
VLEDAVISGPVVTGEPDIYGHRSASLFIGHHLETDEIAFIERSQARSLKVSDVNEYIGAAIVRLNEAEALSFIEKLHRTSWHGGQPACENVTAITPVELPAVALSRTAVIGKPMLIRALVDKAAASELNQMAAVLMKVDDPE